MRFHHILLPLAFVATVSLSGCATFYVDDGLKEVPASAYPRPPSPQSVRLQFQFETNGTSSPRATDFLRNDVVATIAESGLFSRVSTDPFSGGAALSVTINDVGNRGAAAAKGFATGLTLGLAGNVVIDSYTCTLEYAPAPGATKIVKSRSDAIYTTVGAKGAPPHATKVSNQSVAVKTMIRDIVGNALKDIADDPAAELRPVAAR